MTCAPPLRLIDIAASIGSDSELIACAKARAKRSANVLGLLLRDLTREEIAVLESHDCRADDWSTIQVAQDFDAFRIRRTHLRGQCVLGRFSADVDVLPDLRLASGIYDCTLVNCQIGNDCLLEQVRFAAHVVIERDAVLFNIGSITGADDSRFACGARIAVGPETGGREVPLWAEIDLNAAAAIAEQRHDLAGLQAIDAAVDDYADAIASPVAWVRRSARIRHTVRVHASYIGEGTIIDHAAEVVDACLLSTTTDPIRIGTGGAVVSSILHPGVQIAGNAVVRHSVLMEFAGADVHAAVATSIIGPNTHLEKGEVTASLVGPHVGFHHQSLLIATLWPGGKGNVAYGAMVGSNHTGRAPDQECWAGEGCFFGLGCAVRLPCDLSSSPYTTVAQGVTMLPQRVAFPFSLITTPMEPLPEEAGVPRAFNELIPGWALTANAYGLVRAELKLRARDRSKRQPTEPKVLRPAIMRAVKCARDRLAAVTTIKPVYIDEDIEGLGKNALRDDVRLQAIATYDRVLLRFCLRLLLNECEGRLEIPGSAEIAHELADWLMPGTLLDQRLDHLITIEHANAQLVESSKAKDDERGIRIIPGYAAAHPAAAKDLVVISAWERVDRTRQRVQALRR